MTVKIKLTKGYEALIDEEDYERINAYKWHVLNGGDNRPGHVYAITSFRRMGKQFQLTMQTLVLGYKKGFQIDHINNNPLDNTRANLRFATPSQNNLNRREWTKNGIGYRGVIHHGNNKSYMAQIKINGIKHRSPVTRNKHIAALYYNILSLKYGQGFGILNEVPSKWLLD